MQHLFVLPCLTLLAASPASPLSTAEEVLLRARPEAGVVLTRTYTSTAKLRGSDLTVEMDGEPVPAQFLPQLAIELAASERVEVLDTVVDAATTTRRFVDLGGQVTVEVDMGGYMGAEDERDEDAAVSPLAGRTVRFREAAGEEYSAEFVEPEGATAGPDDPKLLAGLERSLDLAGLLPRAAVAEGATWTAPASALAGLFAPGGDLAWRWTDPESQRRADSEEFTGEVELALTALAEVDGRQVARVRLAGQPGRTQVRATDLRDVPVTKGTATETRTATLAVTGELTFDVAGGHLVSADVAAELSEVHHTVKDPGQEGPAYESTLTFAGRHTFEVRVRRTER